VNQPR